MTRSYAQTPAKPLRSGGHDAPHAPMLTAIVRFKLRPGLDLNTMLAEIAEQVPLYQSQPALVRKQISLDPTRVEGVSVYLWRDRAAAEQFFAMARPILREQTGAEPDITLLDTQVIVDNAAGEVWMDRPRSAPLS